MTQYGTDRVYVALDLETTGLNADRDAIIEIGAVRVEDGRVTDRFSTLVNPGRKIPLHIQQITGIRNEDVADAPSLEAIIPDLLDFVGPEVAGVIAHNAAFDLGFLRAAGVNFHRPAFDTFELAAILLPGMASYSLGALCEALDIDLVDAHRALDDAAATGELFLRLVDTLYALPADVITLVLESGRSTEWPPLQLFTDAATARGLSYEPRARTDLSRDVHLPRPDLGDGMLVTGGPPAEVVDAARIDALLGDGGALAARLGDLYEPRAGQLDMAQQVMAAFNRNDHLLIEAGTGVGKSLAYLAPAALWSVANQRQVVIATYTRALQDQLVDKDIPQLHDLLLDQGEDELTWAVLKGRSNYLCVRRLYLWRGARDLPASELSFLAKVLVWMTTTADGDVSGLFIPAPNERALWQEICSDGATCNHARCRSRPGWRDYYLDARARAERAHLLVVNHALLMADIGAGGQVLPPYTRLIVDEAHHLEDAATDQLTYAVDWPRLQLQLGELTAGGDLLPRLLAAFQANQDTVGIDAAASIEQNARRATATLTRFADILTEFTLGHESIRANDDYAQKLAIDGRLRSQPMWSEIEIEWEQTAHYVRTLQDRLQQLVTRLDAAKWAEREPEATLLDALRSTTSDLAELLDHMDKIVFQGTPGSDREIVAWLEVPDQRRNQRNGVNLYAAPLHVGGQIEAGLVHRCRTAIFTGATLRTDGGFDFIRERLGLWDVTARTVESPFDYPASALLYLPSNLPAPNQSGYQAAVEEAILEAALAAGGRTMALFTSYAHLRTTANALRAPLDRAGISLLQHGTSSRSRLLREYRSTDRAVLLGTRSFWEGIDLPGDQLSVLFIVRLPFAVPSDPLVAARSAAFDNAFKEYTLPDAILRFRQGFGRLIRRTTDRGVVVLLDNRIWQKRYGQAFLDALPEVTQRRAPIDNLGAEIDLWLNRARSEAKEIEADQ